MDESDSDDRIDNIVILTRLSNETETVKELLTVLPQLEAMGFVKEEAARALLESKGDIADAIDVLSA